MTDIAAQARRLMARIGEAPPTDLGAMSLALADELSGCGHPASVEPMDGWARLTLSVDGRLAQCGVRLPETEGPVLGSLGIRFGFAEAFGVPSGEPVDQEPDRFLYLPTDFTVDELLALACGEVAPAHHMELVNFSNKHAMSVPRPRFPRSALVMLGVRRSLHSAHRYFELWSQADGVVQFHSLEQTADPNEAANEALDLGYAPTIYRCMSGRFVCFRPTAGGVFIPT